MAADSTTFVTRAQRFMTPYINPQQQRVLRILAKAVNLEQGIHTGQGVDYHTTAAKWRNLMAVVNPTTVMGNLTKEQAAAATISGILEATVSWTATDKNIKQLLTEVNPILTVPEDQLARMEAYLDFIMATAALA